MQSIIMQIKAWFITVNLRNSELYNIENKFMTNLKWLYIDNNIVSIGAKQDLWVEVQLHVEYHVSETVC